MDFERIGNPLAQSPRKLWAHTHSQLRNGEVPPDDKPRPTRAERDKLLAWLENAVERIDAAAPPNPGRPVLRCIQDGPQHQIRPRDADGEPLPLDAPSHGNR